MSEPTPRRRRRRRRNRNRPISSESLPIAGDAAKKEVVDGADDPNAADEAQAETDGRRARAQSRRRTAAEARGGAAVESQRGASAAPRRAPPNTILGMPRLMFGIMAGMLLAVLSVTVLSTVISPADEEDLGSTIRLPDQGRRHLAADETFTNYNSFPPTSGPHDPVGAAPGTYSSDEPAPFDQPPPFTALLPVLEQGGIVLYFDPEALSAAATKQLRAFVDSVRRTRPNIVVTPISPLTVHDPKENLTTEEIQERIVPIVATAWRHLLPLEERADEENGFQKSLAALAEFLAPDPEGYYDRFILDRDGRLTTLRALNPEPVSNDTAIDEESESAGD